MPETQLKPSELKPWMKVWGEDLPDLSECECSAYRYINKRNQDKLGASALRYFDRQIPYGEFFENVEKTAKAFVAAGVKKGDIVSMVSVMTPETIYSFYALDMLGATLNLADPRTSSAGLRDYIHEVHSSVVLSLSVSNFKIENALEALPEVKKVIVVSPADSLTGFKKIGYNLTKKEHIKYNDIFVSWEDFLAQGENGSFTEEPYDPKHAVLIVHTGGTTGPSKGVLLGDYALNALAAQAGFKRAAPGDKFLNIMPPFIAYGYGYGTHTPLAAGMEVILIPQFDPQDFGKLILKYKPEHTAGVPLHYQGLASDPHMKDADLSFMKTTGAGGDAITPQAEDMVNEFLKAHNSQYKLCKGYGMTEASAAIAASFHDCNRRCSVGIPFCHTTVGIFDPETGEELGFNEEGEVCCCTPCAMIGYYENEKETAEVLRTHADGKVWVHTGDIGRLNEDGFLFIVNRIKRVIIRFDGFKVFPVAIENVISEIDGVHTAVAVAIKDRDHNQGNLPFVFVKANPGVDCQELERRIRKVCANQLAEYVVPVGYRFIEEVPYTPIGKVDYLALQKRAETITY